MCMPLVACRVTLIAAVVVVTAALQLAALWLWRWLCLSRRVRAGKDPAPLPPLLVPPRMLLTVMAITILPASHAAGQLIGAGGPVAIYALAALALLYAALYAGFVTLAANAISARPWPLGVIYGTHGVLHAPDWCSAALHPAAASIAWQPELGQQWAAPSLDLPQGRMPAGAARAVAEASESEFLDELAAPEEEDDEPRASSAHPQPSRHAGGALGGPAAPPAAGVPASTLPEAGAAEAAAAAVPHQPGRGRSFRQAWLCGRGARDAGAEDSASRPDRTAEMLDKILLGRGPVASPIAFAALRFPSPALVEPATAPVGVTVVHTANGGALPRQRWPGGGASQGPQIKGGAELAMDLKQQRGGAPPSMGSGGGSSYGGSGSGSAGEHLARLFAGQAQVAAGSVFEPALVDETSSLWGVLKLASRAVLRRDRGAPATPELPGQVYVAVDTEQGRAEGENATGRSASVTSVGTGSGPGAKRMSGTSGASGSGMDAAEQEAVSPRGASAIWIRTLSQKVLPEPAPHAAGASAPPANARAASPSTLYVPTPQGGDCTAMEVAKTQVRR